MIEYFAKPGLEARKERILGLLRSRRELLAVITKLTLSARMYGEDLPPTAPRDLQQARTAERNRHFADLEQQARQLHDDLAGYAHAYPRRLDYVLLGYANAVHGIMLSMRPRHRKAELIAELGIPAATALDVPPIRKIVSVVRVLRAQDQVRRMLAKIDADSMASAADGNWLGDVLRLEGSFLRASAVELATGRAVSPVLLGLRLFG